MEPPKPAELMVVPEQALQQAEEDSYLVMSQRWRQNAADQNRRMEGALLRFQDVLLKICEQDDEKALTRIAAAKAGASIGTAFKANQQNAIKLGALDIKPDKKPTAANRPPQTPIQMNDCNVVLECPGLEMNG